MPNPDVSSSTGRILSEATLHSDEASEACQQKYIIDFAYCAIGNLYLRTI